MNLYLNLKEEDYYYEDFNQLKAGHGRKRTLIKEDTKETIE